MPSGTTVSFNPNPIPAPGSGNSTMTITVGSSTPAGTYPITVTGNGGGIQQNTTVTLTVTAAGAWQQGFDFRNTSTFVTDPPGDTYVLSTTAYPTKGSGVTYGWVKTSLVQCPRSQCATGPAAGGNQLRQQRLTSIRASVRDVEFELLLAVALVVMVIFLFLRSLAATIIPSIAVPLSLIGTFGVMYLAGFSLNNLAMMALTISTGFVVDDAIVMIENISRYIEEGEKPLQAALKGAEQVGFTILSLTVSLIAVLIPLLFMGDIAGRLFRQFAVTLAVTIVISALVSLTLTPMMASRLLHFTPEEKQGRFYHASGEILQKVIDFYGRTLKVVLRYQTLTLFVAVGTLVLTASAPEVLERDVSQHVGQIFVAEIGQRQRDESVGGHPRRGTRGQAAIRTAHHQDARPRPRRRRSQQDAMQPLLLHAHAAHPVGHRQLFEPGGGRPFALAQQVELDGLRCQVARRLVERRAALGGHHRPDQPHGRDFFVRAGHRGLPRSIHRARWIGRKIGLGTPMVLHAVHQFGADRDALARVQAGRPNRHHFVGQGAGWFHGQGLGGNERPPAGAPTHDCAAHTCHYGNRKPPLRQCRIIDMDQPQVTRSQALGLFDAMKQEILSGVQDLIRASQTEILRTFLEFNEGTHIRVRAIEIKFNTNEAALNERLCILERRLAEIEKRLMLDLPGLMDPKTPLQ